MFISKKKEASTQTGDGNYVEPAECIMSLQIMSDLHIEFPGTLEQLPHFNNIAPYLALLGDIGHHSKRDYVEFLLTCATRFQKVFVVAGNHEFFNSNRETVRAEIKKICDQHENLIFMDQTSFLIESKGKKVRVLGTTLWSNTPQSAVAKVERTMNDYEMIWIADKESKTGKRKIKVSDTNSWHEEEVAWLKGEIKKAKKAKEIVVVLTHHVPTHDNPGSGYGFSTNLHSLLKSPVALWCFGHTHQSTDQMVGATRVISNQLGYISFGERTGFMPDFVISMDGKGKTDVWSNNPNVQVKEAVTEALPMAAPPPPPPAPPGPPKNSNKEDP